MHGRVILKKPPSSFQDSLIIDSRSAVLFRPDSLQMEKIRQVNDQGIFASLTHDCYYQMSYARMVMQRQWPALRQVEAQRYRWLIFKKADGTEKEIDLNEVNDICGIFLFDGIRNPVRADMTNIATGLRNYFRK